MIRAFIILAIVGLAAANAINEVAPDVRAELLPKEVSDYLSRILKKNEWIIKPITDYCAKGHEDEVSRLWQLAALKEKSPELGEKAETLHSYFKEKINSLGDEAKGFAKEVIGGIRKLQSDFANGKKPSFADLRKKIQSAILKYKALSDDAKADLQKQFPILTSVFKNEKFQKAAQEYLDRQGQLSL